MTNPLTRYHLHLTRQYRRFGPTYVRVADRADARGTLDGKAIEWTCEPCYKDGFTSSSKFVIKLRFVDTGKAVLTRWFDRINMETK